MHVNFQSSEYFMKFNVWEVLFKVGKRFLWLFLPLISISTAKWMFGGIVFLFSYYKKFALEIHTKMKGMKQGGQVINNKKYLAAFFLI